MIFIEEKNKTDNTGKYEHPDEKAWRQDNDSGKTFKPFDPERALPYVSKKDKNRRAI